MIVSRMDLVRYEYRRKACVRCFADEGGEARIVWACTQEVCQSWKCLAGGKRRSSKRRTVDAVKEDMWLVGVGGFGGGTRLAVATPGGNSSEKNKTKRISY